MKRKGFTLTEMLVVITIIAILGSLLLTAFTPVMKSAKLAKVKVDLTQLDSAIGAFQVKYGTEPPSGIWLCEDPNDWIKFPQSRYYLTQIWTGFDFTIKNDINRNGKDDPPRHLNGAECLVFFLGGIFDNSTVPVGFSANPSNPFGTGKTRVGPFYEFNISRLIDVNNNDYKEYTDGLSSGQCDPIIYYSSYGGQGYNPEDCYKSPYNIGSNSKEALKEIFKYQGEDGMFLPYVMKPINENYVPYKQRTRQLVSPGFDGILGDSGVWDSQNEEHKKLLLWRPTDPNATDFKGKAEHDNITNFATHTLISGN